MECKNILIFNLLNFHYLIYSIYKYAFVHVYDLIQFKSRNYFINLRTYLLEIENLDSLISESTDCFKF